MMISFSDQWNDNLSIYLMKNNIYQMGSGRSGEGEGGRRGGILTRPLGNLESWDHWDQTTESSENFGWITLRDHNQKDRPIRLATWLRLQMKSLLTKAPGEKLG